MREEFEERFASISINAVNNAKGSIAVTMGMPTKWSPNEYSMTSHWKDTNSLKAFAGNDWSQPHIPEGMAKFVDKMWVYHFESNWKFAKFSYSPIVNVGLAFKNELNQCF